MKAIRVQDFGEPEVMRLDEVPDPKPGAGEALVRIEAAGVNPVESYLRSGTYAIKPSLPFTPGSDGAGVVESVGPGVTEFKPGDRVYVAGSITGTYAEKALCRVEQVHPLPKNVSFAQGAAIGVPYGTAWRALVDRAAARAGETVLVHGATGGVGIAAVQIARARGLHVFGTGGSEQGREMARREGAHRVFDHHAPDYRGQLMDATGDRGVDIVLEMLANVNLGYDLAMLARSGRVVVIGSRGPVEINPRDAMARDAAILGMILGNASASEMRGIHRALVAGLENGTLRPVIGEEIPLEDAPRAHRRLFEGDTFGKIVLVP